MRWLQPATRTAGSARVLGLVNATAAAVTPATHTHPTLKPAKVSDLSHAGIFIRGTFTGGTVFAAVCLFVCQLSVC